MKRTFHALLLALFLAAIGLSIFVHKLTVLDLPFLPNRTFDTWYVEAKVALDSQVFPPATATEAPSRVRFYLPQDSSRYEIAQESFINNGFERTIESDRDNSSRTAVFTRQDGEENNKYLFYRANIKRKPGVTAGREEVPLSGRKLVNNTNLRSKA